MLSELRPALRRLHDRIDVRELRAARKLVARMRIDPPDVVHLGASESVLTGPTDVDHRTLPIMIDDALGTSISLFSIAGPGYNPALFRAYLELLDAFPQRPVLVVGLCVRFCYPAWSRHPVYGHERAAASIRRTDPTKPLWRIRGTAAPPSDAAFAALDRLPHRSFAGGPTVGDHRGPLKNPSAFGLDAISSRRLLYAYHHGARIEDDGTWVAPVASLAAALRNGGFPTVCYQLPIPIEEGTTLLGPAFADCCRSNLAQLIDTFREENRFAEVVETGTAFSTSAFIDPADSTEHLNDAGRRELAAMLVPAIRRQLAPGIAPAGS